MRETVETLAFLVCGMMIFFGLPWLLAIGCVALGGGPEVCGM